MRGTLDLRHLSRHIPREADGSPIEFVRLGEKARGSSMLGVLKADADSLGAAIRGKLALATDLTPLRSLSSKLEQFFGSQLDEMMSAPGSAWAELYTVFSGGDDIMLVGPWNVVVDFAAQIRAAFARHFVDEKLTISAGVALVKPKFPIRLGAGEAEALLEQAKTRPAPGAAAPKDQLAALGGCWKWSDHQRIVGAGKRLAGWVESGDIERGWLHTLIELTLLQRSTRVPRGKPTGAMYAPAPDPGAGARSEAVVPAMAGSRLAYHVARNWPRQGPARQWIDAVRLSFDHPETSDPVFTHLPSVLRYAVLATRSPSDKE